MENSFKIGVLLPQSKEYPTISKEFLDGLKLYFTIHDNLFLGRKAELVIEDIGFGTERVSLEKTRKLITLDEVDVIGGLMEFNTALQVGNMAEIMNVPMLIGGLGETKVAREKIPANLYFHSFMLWQSFFELGNYVGESLKEKELLIVTSLFDVGYDSHRAFMLGLKSKKYDKYETYISKAYDSGELLQDLEDNFNLDANKAWCLLLHPELINGFLRKIELKPNCLFTSPFVTDNESGGNVWSFVELSKKHEKYRKLVDGINEYIGMSPTHHHALGFQQGQLIYHALQQLENLTDIPRQIYSAWDGFEEETVVGRTWYSAGTKFFESGIKLYEGGRCEDFESHPARKRGDIPPASILELSQERNQYTNPYMFM
ncbi:ABC transporter substrate-binding protein [Algoriphagus sp. Y33]|uniref:ABC transporter substrate-binding protein n=1 Tax=Algoriphagus sp. Y33 TaxID=2772483 RepID=UPI00177DF395|nr:ABC transporter substrate-binding protein [Algoriphagus sp. Y33]